jgi:hypothetical protein
LTLSKKRSSRGSSWSCRQTALTVSIGRGGARSMSLMPCGSCSISELTTRPTPRPSAM